MTQDTIIEQLHYVREQLAQEFNFDVYAIVADAKAHQTQTGHPVVTFAQPPTMPPMVDDEIEKRAA